MILLLGGTSETAPLAEALAGAGYHVLVSTASDVELEVGRHERIVRRTGPLKADDVVELIEGHGVRGIVDATHPYAQQAHRMTDEAAQRGGVPLFRLHRPSGLEKGDIQLFGRDTSDSSPGEVCPAGSHEALAAPESRRSPYFAEDHEHAAELACRAGRSILLTVGANNVAVYVRRARAAGAVLAARVLDREESVRACLEAGLERERIIVGRGPFSEAQNRQHIRRFAADVLVTKDSGQAGGLSEKLAAARAEGCRVIVLRRPAEGASGARVFEAIDDLVAAVRRIVV